MLLKNAERDLKTPDKRFDLIQHLEMFIHNNSRKFFFQSLFSRWNFFRWKLRRNVQLIGRKNVLFRILHPHNNLMISVKQKLGSMYGNCTPYEYKNLNVPMLERKLQVWSAWIKINPARSRGGGPNLAT